LQERAFLLARLGNSLLLFLDLNGMALILLLGGFLGSAGSLFSLRRFIRTWRALKSATHP